MARACSSFGGTSRTSSSTFACISAQIQNSKSCGIVGRASAGPSPSALRRTGDEGSAGVCCPSPGVTRASRSSRESCCSESAGEQTGLIQARYRAAAIDSIRTRRSSTEQRAELPEVVGQLAPLVEAPEGQLDGHLEVVRTRRLPCCDEAFG